MDNVLNKFYNGTNTGRAFGSPFQYSTIKQMNLSRSKQPYPLYDIRGQMQPQLRTDYSLPKSLTSNNNPPIGSGSINLSMTRNNGLIARQSNSLNPMSKTSIIPYDAGYSHTLPNAQPQNSSTPIDQLYASSLTKRFYTPEVMKMQILEEKIKQLDKTTRQDKADIRDIIEGHMTAQAYGQTMPVNPNNIQQQMQMNHEIRESRRMEIKKELEEARMKMRHDNNHNYRNYSRTERSDSDYDDDDDSRSRDRDSFESVRFKGRKASIVSQTAPIGLNPQNTTNNNFAPRQSILLPNLGSPARKRSVMAPTVNTEKARQETYDLIQQIPSHCAFQLQSDSFKTRENIILIKSGLKEMRADMQNKLDQMEMKQKLNLENIRYALEKGGTTKLIYAVKKYLDKDDVNLDSIGEDVPEYVRSIPGIVDQLINERENVRKEEEMLERKRYRMERLEMENEDMYKKANDEMAKKMIDEKIKKEEEEKAKLILPKIGKAKGNRNKPGIKKKKTRGKTAKGKKGIEEELNPINEEEDEEMMLPPKKKKKKKIQLADVDIDPDTFPGNTVKPKQNLKLKTLNDNITSNNLNTEPQEPLQKPKSKSKTKKPLKEPVYAETEPEIQPKPTKKKKKKQQI